MSLSSVGAAMGAQQQIQTMEQVNMNLIKQSTKQAEQQVSQLLEVVAPSSSASGSSGSLGQHVDVYV